MTYLFFQILNPAKLTPLLGINQQTPTDLAVTKGWIVSYELETPQVFF